MSGHLSFSRGAPIELEADYLVVGSGAGGAAAAVTLARAGRSVALCEAGPWRDPEDYPSSVYGSMRDLWSDWGQLLALGESLIPIVQASCVGGTTVINSAIIVRTPGDVLADWSTRFGLGDVFNEQRVGEAQDLIERELEVAQMRSDQLQRHNEMLIEALHARGFEGHAIHRSAARCEGTAQCLQGCRIGAKQSTNLCWIPEVIERGGTVLSCAPVQRVLFERGRAVGVSGRFRDPRGARGARFKLRAKRGVLIAASATGSAPLLERSGLRLPGLGKGWRAHPGGAMVGIYPFEVQISRGATQGAASLHFRDQGLKLESLSLPAELLAARLAGAGRSLAASLELIPRVACWVAAVRAQTEGTVHQGRFSGKPVVRYSPIKADIRRLQQGLRQLAELHFEAGAIEVSPGIAGVKPRLGPDELHLIDEAPLDNRCYTWVLSHLFGGCTMGADPQTSVVAPDLTVRSTEALHVVDAACLPTTLGVNPQHTIMAVAMIVAERLANA